MPSTNRWQEGCGPPCRSSTGSSPATTCGASRSSPPSSVGSNAVTPPDAALSLDLPPTLRARGGTRCGVGDHGATVGMADEHIAPGDLLEEARRYPESPLRMRRGS